MYHVICTRPECQGTAGCVCPKAEVESIEVTAPGLVEFQEVYPNPEPVMPPPMLGSFSTFLGDPQLARIAEALERIAKALERPKQ